MINDFYYKVIVVLLEILRLTMCYTGNNLKSPINKYTMLCQREIIIRGLKPLNPSFHDLKIIIPISENLLA